MYMHSVHSRPTYLCMVMALVTSVTRVSILCITIGLLFWLQGLCGVFYVNFKLAEPILELVLGQVRIQPLLFILTSATHMHAYYVAHTHPPPTHPHTRHTYIPIRTPTHHRPIPSPTHPHTDTDTPSHPHTDPSSHPPCIHMHTCMFMLGQFECYYESGRDAIPPVKLDLCISIGDSEVTLLEPLV